MKKKTALLIEDNTDFRTFCRLVLERAGFVVWETTNEVDGFKLLAEHPGIELVVSDDRIPPGSGMAFLKSMRGMKLATPFILMSGLKSFSVKDFEDLGAVTFIAKPFAGDQLIELVRKLLAQI